MTARTCAFCDNPSIVDEPIVNVKGKHFPSVPRCGTHAPIQNRQKDKVRTLKLTLKRNWFRMIADGVKKEEYRQPSKWMLSRLRGKTYDAVEFRNGYSPFSPVITLQFLGWDYACGRKEWGGGSSPDNPLIVIRLGDIISPPSAPPSGER